MRCKIPTADLQQKLHDTICRYQGSPVYVLVKGASLDLYTLTDTLKPFAKIKATDPDFDVSGVPLGYIQKNTEVFYLTRLPVRKVKQGLDVKYIRARKITVPGEPMKISHETIFSQAFIDMIKGIYPPLGTSLKTLRDAYAKNPKLQMQVAISRNIAMYIDEMGRINVYYKGDFVGWMQPDKDVVHVPSNDMGWVVSKYLSHELSWKID